MEMFITADMNLQASMLSGLMLLTSTSGRLEAESCCLIQETDQTDHWEFLIHLCAVHLLF